MRLLLAEDDEALAARLQRELEQAGYVLDRAADGMEAQFLGETENYDLVILTSGFPSVRAWKCSPGSTNTTSSVTKAATSMARGSSSRSRAQASSWAASVGTNAGSCGIRRRYSMAMG